MAQSSDSVALFPEQMGQIKRFDVVCGLMVPLDTVIKACRHQLQLLNYIIMILKNLKCIAIWVCLLVFLK